MIRFALKLLLLPFRILVFFYYQIAAPFRKGEHVFMEIPLQFLESKKSAFLEFISGSEHTNQLYVFFLRDLLAILENPYIKKVSFVVGNIEFGYGELEEILKLVQRMNQKGIKTSGFALTGNLKTLLFLSHMKERYTIYNSKFYPMLPSAEVFFFKGFLEKLGVEVEAFASGKQKSLGETFTREKFSPPARKNLSSLLNSLKEILLAQLNQNFSQDWKNLLTPVLAGATLFDKGFFDGILDEEDFQKGLEYPGVKGHIDESKKKEVKYSLISLSSVIFFAKKKRFQLFPKKVPSVAIVSLKGEIFEGKREEKDLKEGSIHAYPVIQLLRELRDDKNVHSIILEIDSPGGSAFGSRLIYEEIKKVSAQKKIYAYMKNVAASGGYFLACGCELMYSHSLCIVGSVGTIMLRAEASGLYKKLGITKDRIGFYPKREIFSEYGKLSQESRYFIQHEIEREKNEFYNVVRESRKFSEEEMEERGGGKVFSGAQGLELKLIDSLDGLIGLLEKIEQEAKTELAWEYILPMFNLRSLYKNWNTFIAFQNHPFRQIEFLSKREILCYSNLGSYLRSFL